MASETARLQLLYDLNRKLATFTELDDLLRFATRSTRELFDAEGCSLLLHDAATNELYFPIASQRESSAASGERLRDVRFPATQGIAGWVLGHQEAVAVADVTRDPRFYSGVDASTRVVTRSILCAPLRGRSDFRGVVCVVNPGTGTAPEDARLLEAIADDMVVAFDRAALFTRLTDDARQGRRIGRMVGLAMMGFGIVVALATVFGHAARALPMAEVAAGMGLWTGVALAVLGGLLVRGNREGRGTSPE